MTTTDHQVQHLWKLRFQKKYPLYLAAAKSGMSEKTARKYLCKSVLPSENKHPRDWVTRKDPFESIWPAVLVLLQTQPDLEAKTVFEEIQRRYPGQFEEGQLRTFQRRVKSWRLEYGASKEVFFEQTHEPGRLCQSDFTHMNEVGVTIQGQSFEHMLYHFVLTYSNWEWASICYSESFESLSEGLWSALEQLGGIPGAHRTDNLAAARKIGKSEFQHRYQAFMAHLNLACETTNPYSGNENGDIEQRHHRLKRTVEQALMLRNSRDFDSLAAYQDFLEQVMRKQNLKRKEKLEQERPLLKPLPVSTWMTCTHQRVRVSKTSTIQVKHKTYSVSSRLIGQHIDVYIYSQRLEIWYAQKCLDILPRLNGKETAYIQYRHVIDWLLKKPGAFANYRYQAQFFPTIRFRMVYDQIKANERGTRQYLEILQLAAHTGEERVDECLRFLLEQDCPLTVTEVKALLHQELPPVTEVCIAAIDLSIYDQLLEEQTWPELN